MSGRKSSDDDQIATFRSELRSGGWIANSRRRARRRKSLWNLLLLFFGLPLWLGCAWLLVNLGYLLRSVVAHQYGPGLSSAALDIPGALILIPSLLASIAPAMMLTNFLIYLIPPARRAMDLEDAPHPGTGYAPSQRALSKLTGWGLAAWLLLVVVATFVRGAV